MVYLDNMFAGLKKTHELERLKQQLLSGMEDKYHELKMNGKSENEAIGIVISEFGNIDELTAELGIHHESGEQQIPFLTVEEAYDYAATRRSSGFWTGLGVFLAVCGVALFIFIDTLFENNSIMVDNSSTETGALLGLIGMFVLIAVAVGMFIYSGMKLERFKNLEQGFQLPFALKSELQHSQNQFAMTYRISVIMGVCLCVLSPVFIFAATFINDDSTPYGVAVFLLTTALAVFLFVYYGNIQGAYTKLLHGSRISSAEKKEDERIIGAIAAIVWPLATAVFLFTGFVYQRWDINWAIFPITGILFGMFSSVYHILKRKDVS